MILISFLLPLAAFANEECSAVLRHLLQDATISEANLLSRFNPAEIHAPNILGNNNSVFSVKTSTGKYVIRIEAPHTDLEREVFAITFARGSPMKSFPQVKILSESDTHAVKESFKKLFPGSHQDILNSKKISISAFYPAKEGTKYLSELRLNHPFREILGNAYDSGEGITEQNVSKLKERLFRTWQSSTPQAQMSFAHEIKTLYPATANMGLDDTFFYLNDHLSMETAENFQLLGLKRVPKNVIQQLSNSWAIFTALGIHDFHFENWLIHEGIVLPIDLGNPIEKDAAMTLMKRRNPFSGHDVSPKILQLIRSNTSPEVIHYLETMNSQTLANYAKTSGYNLSKEEENFILTRTQNLLKVLKELP